MLIKQTQEPQMMEDLGMQLFHACEDEIGCIIYLVGELGAGKTTLVRGFLRASGYSGTVKSPTYTLVEPYEIAQKKIFHFDLYRLQDPQELEYLGIRDYLQDQVICLIEWPQRGEAYLPECDLLISINHQDNEREVIFKAMTQRGKDVLQKFVD